VPSKRYNCPAIWIWPDSPFNTLSEWRRPSSGGEEEEEEGEEPYSSLVEERTAFNTAALHQEAAGLKLFLDILNGPDNPAAEAELR